MVKAFKNRLGAFARATWLSRSVADLPYTPVREETSLYPYKSETQAPCKYDGHEISYRCDSW